MPKSAMTSEAEGIISRAHLRRHSRTSSLDSKRSSIIRSPRRSTFRLSRSTFDAIPETRSVFCDELVLMIMDYFASTFDDSQSKRTVDRRSLLACSRVSRFWNQSANKHLYQCAELTSFSQCARFRRTCDRRPHLAAMVKVLTLPHTWASCMFATGGRQQKMALANIEHAAELLRLLPNLEIFKLSTTQRVPFSLYASYFDDDIQVITPFKHLKNLCLSHQACYDFTVRAPLPWHMDFSQLESLSLSRFVIWHDDVWPMTWPHLPSLKHLTLEECFLDGEELAHLLTQVSDSLKSIHLCRSLFSISIMSEGLGVVSESLEELFISEQWGFEDNGTTFSHFTALKTLKLESSTCCSALYTKLPPNIETLQVSAMQDGYASSRVLEEVLGFLETDVHTYLPNFRALEIKADADHFDSWAEHIKRLCASQNISVEMELLDRRCLIFEVETVLKFGLEQPFAHTPLRVRNTPLSNTFSWTWKGLKLLRHLVTPAEGA